MQNSTIRAMIFDLDGTLAHTLPDLCTAMNGMRRHFGFSDLTEEDILRTVNNGPREFIRLSLPEAYQNDADLLEEAIPVYEAHYAECYADKTYAFETLFEQVRALKEKGYRLGVLSNKADSFVKIIIEKLFPGLFEEVWGQKQFPSKPDPTSALHIASLFEAKPEEIIFIGDSDVDMKTAVNSGMIALGAAWGYRPEDVLRATGAQYIAREPADLTAVIEEITGEAAQ